MEFRLIKKLKDRGRWRIFKLKLIDARLYFVSIFVGLLTGLLLCLIITCFSSSSIFAMTSLILILNGIGTFLFFC